MKSSRWLGTIALGIVCFVRPSMAGENTGLRQGDRLQLNGRTLSILTLDTLPCVTNQLTERCQFDRYGDPVLEKLRRDCRLDDVIAPGGNEFEKQLLLMEWAHRQIQYGDPVELGKVRDPLKLLELSKKGRVLYCECFASLYIAAAASLGWVCRPIDIPTHSFTEIWSSQHRKWIMFDPTGHFYAEKDDAPLNTYEIRQDWFENSGKGLIFRRGRERYQGGGRSFAPYTVLYYVLKREWLGNRPADGAMVTKDKWSAGRGPNRDLLDNPEADPYVPVNQAALTLAPEGRDLRVTVRTWTPNFKAFRIRLDGGPWTDTRESFIWPLHAGINLLEVKSVNLFEAGGPVSTVEVWVSDSPSGELVLPACAFTAEGGGRTASRPREGSASPAYVHLWNTTGHWLEWAFDCPAAGEYDVTLAYATLFHPARRMTLNGEAVKELEAFTVGPTRRWDNFSESRLPARVKLRQGRNVLRLTCLDDTNLLLSEIRLSSADRPGILIPGTSYHAEGGGQARRMVSPREGYFRFWDDKGHWLEWTLDDVDPGTYTVYMQYATLYNPPRELRVNGQVVPGLEDFTLPMTGNWLTWGEHRLPAPVPLQKGRNVLRLTNTTGKGVNMVGLRLVAPGGKELFVPAVSYSAQDGGKVLVVSPSRHRSFHGWDRKDHWLEWTVRNAAEGDYEVVLHYAAEKPASRELQLNGHIVQGFESVTVQPTGGWQTWRETRLPGRLHLKAGDNVLRLTNVDGRSLNLDELRLVPVGKP